ncbi:MAG: (2Fe-2S)-binding protein [Bacteroidetes bacterium]|nr:(2Fe-2S)-binding protein [Rhodothermaceae bacterium RA]RMH63967.1 MAG: (2Fe-2S)-binding protein [Bacteroidota bacterium]
MQIDRCYCFQQTFAALRALARAHGVQDLQGLQQHVDVGLRCGLCHPYIRRMLRTGETVFHTILTEADEPA